MPDRNDIVTVVQVVVGLGLGIYLLFKLKELVMYLLFAVAAAIHAFSLLVRFVHKQLWHQRLEMYVPGFKPPVSPRVAPWLFGVLVLTAVVVTWDLLRPERPTQDDWVKGLQSTPLELTALPAGTSVETLAPRTSPFGDAIGVEVRISSPDRDGVIHYYVFSTDQEAQDFFSAFEAAGKVYPEWKKEHTIEYEIGEVPVLCVDRVDPGIGCFIRVPDGTVVQAHGGQLPGETRAQAAAEVHRFLETGLWHWLRVADQLGLPTSESEP